MKARLINLSKKMCQQINLLMQGLKLIIEYLQYKKTHRDMLMSSYPSQ